jgi:hypothetical protein
MHSAREEKAEAGFFCDRLHFFDPEEQSGNTGNKGARS